jgi:hypothetical protein
MRATRRRAKAGGGLGRTRRLERLAESGGLIPSAEANQVRPVVELGLVLWASPKQRLARRLGLLMILWSFGVPAILGATQGRWRPTIGLVVIGLLLLAFERYLVRRHARLVRTAQVNGWLENGQPADAI